ncbi:EAL domain-containing protein [Rhodoblastus sp.]|uniref:putative bifunctional diguanylate cyclase/phosphodiesterase n=1 Tax=Rhodoblastus sp. TaxID=1962975 RepID=UPI0025D928B2|nr:EAL domain-containing protein [Rhodoblastus sp.]
MLVLPSLLDGWRRTPVAGIEQELDLARLSILIANLPLLYGVICVHIVVTAYSFSGVAPRALVYGLPLAFILFALVRAVHFMRLRRFIPVDGRVAHDMLRIVQFIAVGFGTLGTAWMVALYLYGDSALRSQLVFSVVITNMICSYILGQLPRVALTLAGISMPGFLLLLMLTGGPDAPVIAMNLGLVGLFLAYIVMVSARDFEKMVAAKLHAVELAEENRLLANTDSLTGLPNRREFFERLECAIREEGEQGALVMGVIDLDGFKPINDLYGHAIGDCVLRECAARLQIFASGGTTIARLGGDEFAIFTRGCFEESDILRLGEEVCAALRAPLRFADIHAGVSASIGFARYPQDAMDGHHLYERADYALYFGKQNHRGAAVLFSSEHESKMLLNARIEQALRKADFEQELTIRFQPLLHVATRRIVAFEALARWTSPDLGDVSPEDFIPVAESGELIHAITRAALRKALRAARNWPHDIKLSFNISIRDLVSQRALTQIMTLIEGSGFDPSRLDIEVTETALVADFERAAAAIAQLKRMGVNISLDDFGAGHSSLAYIHRLPLDMIKIDRSFVQEMHVNSIARDIVRSMIGLCANLNLDCVTEGVETQEQFDLLRGFGGTFVQGFLFCRPVPEDEVAGVIEQYRPGCAGQALSA